MAPCITLTVQAPNPVVKVLEGGFAKKNPLGGWDYAGDANCQESSALVGTELGFKCKVEVTNSKANFNITVDSTDPTGASSRNTYTFTGVDVGTYTYDLTTFDTYMAGNYAGLAIRAANVTPG